MHGLLERQLRSHFGGLESVPPGVEAFVAAVDAAYASADQDRRLVERSLELTSQELLQRNAELRTRQREQQLIFDSVPALIIMKDTRNRMLRVNQTAAAALGKPVAELEGADTAAVFPKEVADRLYQDDLEVVRSGVPKLGIIEAHPGPDGTTRWMRTDKVPVRGEGGEVEGIIVLALDITEQKRAEQASRTSDVRKAAILESALDPILTMDAKGLVQDFNPAAERLFGYSRQEAIGHPLSELIIPPALRERHRQGLARYLATGEGPVLGRRIEITAIRRDGTEFPVELAIAPFSMEGEPMFTGYIRDITDRKQQEAKLRQAYEGLQKLDRERTQFINNAAHELGTPLTPIKLQIHLVKGRMERRHDLDQVKSVEILERNFDRLSHLVRDLLDSARIQADSLRLEPRHLDLSACVRTAVENYADVARSAGTELVVIALPPLPVHADAARIGQVLDNLLSNATKFTPPGGRVQVSGSTVSVDQRPYARIEVTDSGTGIKEEDLGRLFKPFQQVHDVMQRTRAGTGLGLYICRGLVEASGGRIGATSPGLRKGSTFWFTLPLAHEN